MGWTAAGNLKGPKGDPGDPANITAHEAAADPHSQYTTSSELATAQATKADLVHASRQASNGADPVTPSAIGAAASAHTHDDRYYTETETDTKLAGKASTTHAASHASGGSDVVTPAAIGAAAASHTHTTSQVTGLDTTLAGKAAAVHTHGVGDLTATGTKDSTTVLHGDNVFRVPASSGGGVTDHGNLTGLADDDHPQYHNDTRGDARYRPLNASVPVPSGSQVNVGASDSAAAFAFKGTGVASPYMNSKVGTDTSSRYTVNASGDQAWGPGNAATDVTLWRDSAGKLLLTGQLQTTGQLSVPTLSCDVVNSHGAVAASICYAAKLDADTNNRFEVLADGTNKWGSGAAATDTSLLRNGAGILRTPGQLQVGGALTAGSLNVTGSPTFNGGIMSGQARGVPNMLVLDTDVTTTSTTAVAIPAFSFTSVQGARYGFEFFFVYFGSVTTIDPVYTITGTTSGFWSSQAPLDTNTTATGPINVPAILTTASLAVQGSTAANQNMIANGAGTLLASGTTIQFQQRASATGTVGLRAGSWIRIFKIVD